MQQTRRKRSAKRWTRYAIIGLLVLSPLIWWWWTRPKQVIKRNLSADGFDSENVKYWICVSAFETAKWTSSVFKQTNNLFGIVYYGANSYSYGKLTTGEGQSMYRSLSLSCQDLIHAVIRPFKYSKNYQSISQLVSDMKLHGYFTGSQEDYLAGVEMYYEKFYG